MSPAGPPPDAPVPAESRPAASGAPGASADTAPTGRLAAKARRRRDLLEAAARLFAARGYDGVRLEDIGAACGVSGPAVYRHFANKAAVLAEVLEGASRDLLAGALATEDSHPAGEPALRALIAFHTDFALTNRDLIRVQDRDLRSLPPEEQAEVTATQRSYIDVWARQLRAVHPEEDTAAAVFRAQAVLGLLNSTPRSVRRSAADRAARRSALVAMAWAAASAPGAS